MASISAQSATVTFPSHLAANATTSNQSQVTSKPTQTRPEPQLHRRDSQKRRESLLKGKEGSRRRQRWENDRLLSNPYAQPPLPSDWVVQPTHPVHIVPYYLAPLWDAGLSQRASKVKDKETRKNQHNQANPTVQVPKELRATFKRAKSGKGLLQDLEEQVRSFVASWQAREHAPPKSPSVEVDSEDEDIVFVGRQGDVSPRESIDRRIFAEDDVEKLLMRNLADDRGAKFGRWLVHNIAAYYGLRTWSVTVGDPAQREAYVGIPLTGETGNDPADKAYSCSGGLPIPLWVLL